MTRWRAATSRRRLLAICALAALAATPAESRAADAVEGPAADAGGVWDPWEPMNRPVFAMNEFFDRWLLEPVAIGWDFVVPEPLQQMTDAFLENLAMPRRIANDLLQGKPRKAGDDLGRFLINTTFGMAGLFDPAGAEGYPPADEDFGQTLGVWGVPPGPYWVLPLLGPSSPRDAAGLAVESLVMSPENYYVPFYVTYSRTAVSVVNTRSLALETVRAEREAAFDFYAAVRNAYVSFRANQVRDRADAPEEEDDDFYYLDEEE